MSQDEWHAGFLATTTRPREVGSGVEKSRKETERFGSNVDTRERKESSSFPRLSPREKVGSCS